MNEVYRKKLAEAWTIIDTLDAQDEYEAVMELAENYARQKQQLKALELTVKTQIEAINYHRRRVALMTATMRSVATDLAQAGGMDHKSKNEVILRSIYILLDWRERADDIPNADDVPF